MKKLILLLTIALIISNVQADALSDFLKEDDAEKVEKSAIEKELDKLDANIAKYKKELLEISKKMHKLRVDLIKKDPTLKKVHDKIMALHRELAIKIDLNENMKELLKKSIRINNTIKEIEEEKRIKSKKKK